MPWIAWAAVLACAQPAQAEEMRATTAAEVCSPTADPCVISSKITMDSASDFDFGLRTVRVVAGGKITFDRAHILCGAFLADGPASRTSVEVTNEEYAGSLRITARRSCSGSPSTPCLEDSQCAAHGLGACSGGSGVIVFDSKLDANHNDGAMVLLRAADDITLNAAVSVNGIGNEGDAGELTIDSLGGDVVVNAPVNIRQAPPQGNYGYGRPYPPGYAGYLTVDAGRDVLFQRQVDLTGDYNGGEITISAGRDIVVAHNVLRDGISGTYSSHGGDGRLHAGRDVRVEPHGPTQDLTFLTADAGHYFYHYGYGYGGFEAGRGGYTSISTSRALRIQQKTVVSANSPQDDCQDGIPYGGVFHIETEGGFDIDGRLSVNAAGWCGNAGNIYMYGYGDGQIGPTGAITATGVGAGDLWLRMDGDVTIDGDIDVRADRLENYYGVYGEGGEIDAHGDDLVVSGRVRSGGPEGGWGIEMSGCRTRLRPTAKIQAPSDSIRLSFHESLIAEQGSLMEAEEGYISLYGGSPEQPPVLLGTVDPAPEISPGNPHGWPYCPPCGNGRIEPGESCDDGNITDDDGCTSECVHEGCIADTPGYPEIGLCDDGSECTEDRCDALAGACVHEPGCSDDLECTQEQCAGDTCQITPIHAACDDGNPCTSDLCNAETGCVHGTLVGSVCDDGDLCTSTSTCSEEGRCGSDQEGAQVRGTIAISLRDDAQDRLTANLRIDGTTAPVTETGLTVRLFAADGSVVFTESIPAAAFTPGEDDDQTWVASRAIGDTRTNVLLRRERDDGAAVRLKIRRGGLEAVQSATPVGISLLFGTDPAAAECHSIVTARCRFGKKLVCRG